MKRGLVLLVALLFSTLAHADMSGEESGKPEFSGNIELGGIRTTGNSDTQTVDGEINLGYKFHPWYLDFYVKGSQVSESGVVTSDYLESELKGKYEFLVKYYAFILVGYREDYFGGIYYESKHSAGLGYHVFEEDSDIKLDFELGYGVRDTKKVSTGKHDMDPGAHFALFSSYEVTKKDDVELNFELESGNDDDFIKKEMAWKHKLSEAFHVKLTYENRTATKPEIGKVGTDTSLTVKLGAEF